MAAATLSYNDLDVNGSITDPTGTSVSTDGATLANAFPEQTVLRIVEGGTAATTLTVKAGAQPPAIANGVGDLSISVAKGGTEWAGPFDSSRFLQADGSLTFDAGAAVTVTVFKVARH